MKMKNSVKLIFASALLLTAASCSKDVALQVPGESPVRFEVGVDGTKATLINNEGAGFESFKTSGFSVIAYEGTTKKMDNVAVTWSGSAWTYTEEYLWKKDTDMRFFGYYPQALATTLDGKTTNSGIASFTYSPLASGVSANVTGQTDYMLATYNGKGNNGVAALNFSHPLASVKFKVGTFDSSVAKIKSIAIGGFYKTATCTPTVGDAGFTYTWSSWDGTADDGALSQSDLNLTPAANVFIGTPFLLIPGQNFSSKNLTVLLTVTIGGADKTLLATINSGTLEQGKTTTCTINYEGGKGLNFSCTLTDWVESESDKKDIEVEEVKKELHITSLADLNAFKAQIESPIDSGGKDYSGYTIFLDNPINLSEGVFYGIYDQYSRLKGATFDGKGNGIVGAGSANTYIHPNDNDSNGTAGFFSTLKSDNVTLKNIRFENITSEGSKDVSFLAGTYEGSQITIDNCTFSNLTGHSTASDVMIGMIIGICKGNATITKCNISSCRLYTERGSYTSCVIGEVNGAIDIDIESITINGCTFSSARINKVPGFYVGHCANFNGMNIQIKDCVSFQNNKDDNWPGVSDNLYLHTGSGRILGISTTSHFNAVAWNVEYVEAPGLTVSISGMDYDEVWW